MEKEKESIRKGTREWDREQVDQRKLTRVYLDVVGGGGGEGGRACLGPR